MQREKEFLVSLVTCNTGLKRLNANSRSNTEVSNEKVAELLNLRDDAPDKII